LLFFVLFGCAAIAEHWFLHRKIWDTTASQLTSWANDVVTEINYKNKWDLAEYRNAAPPVPEWYAFTMGGLVIDIEADVPGFLPKAHPLQAAKTELNEEWQLITRKIQGGLVLCGIPNAQDAKAATRKLDENLSKFPNTIAEAQSVRPRKIDGVVEYAVLSDDGDIVNALGGVPLQIDQAWVERVSALKGRVKIGGKPYFIFSQIIRDGFGKPVATIVIPQEISLEEGALRSLDTFNVGLLGLCGIVTIGVALFFVGRDIVSSSAGGSLGGVAVKFVLGRPLPIEETREYEFKEVTSKRPVDAIVNAADEYAVAFLNGSGGRIFWGVRDKDRVVVGVRIAAEERNLLRQKVSGKLHAIQPQIDPVQYRLEIHPVEKANTDQETGELDLFVVELVVPRTSSQELYFTGGNEAFVRVDGVKKKLTGPQLVDWIRRRMPS
jgi:hypothetical protein